MRFAIFNFVLLVWVLWRFVLPLRAEKCTKIIFAAALALIGLFPAFTATFMGGLLSPEAPRWLLVAGNAGTAFLLVLAALTLAREVVILMTVLAGRSGEAAHEFVQKDRRATLGLAAAAGGLAALGIDEGIKVPDVVEHKFAIKDLPEEFNGFTFVQLSDIHCSALLTEPRTAALVERVMSLKPEMIVITGDLADGAVEHRLQDTAPLAGLSAPFGVWACEGNHEHYGDYEGWMVRWASLGIRMLRNEHVMIRRNGGQLCLAGFCDPHGPRFGREGPDPEKAFAGAPDAKSAPRIVLAHQPKFFKTYLKRADFSLMLSGHTHGGQVNGLARGVAIMNGLYVCGEYRDEASGALLYVHPGSGLWNGFPIRLGVPSEIARITLVRA